MRNFIAVVGMGMMLAAMIILCTAVALTVIAILTGNEYSFNIIFFSLGMGLIGSVMAVAGGVTPKVTNRRT